jgi:hypothetical protein
MLHQNNNPDRLKNQRPNPRGILSIAPGKTKFKLQSIHHRIEQGAGHRSYPYVK